MIINNTYTALDTDQSPLSLKLSAQALRMINFHLLPTLPFFIELEDDQTVSLEKLIRLLPGKRLLAFGNWQDKPVAVKVFYDPHHAKRHFFNETGGIKKLKEHQVPT